MKRRAKKAGRVTRALRRASDASLMTQAAAETIAHRGVKMSQALSSPAAWTDPEMTRMVYEKYFAAGEAGWAMSRYAFAMQRLWAGAAFQFTQNLMRGSPFDLGVTQRLMQRTTDVAVAAADAGATPIRRVARANARRLRAKN